MRRLDVALADRAYPIRIAQTLIDLMAHVRDDLGRQVMVVSPEPVAKLYLSDVSEQLAALGCQVDTLVLPDGEAHKTLATFEKVINELLLLHHDRSTSLIALGGGVTGDITGFAASAYQRGVGFVQIPTTLLAQVDSSVGGKTGVNHPLGKNMIGAFYQPNAVLIALEVLQTLPDREYVAGLAEVIKYGLIYDADFFDWLEQHLGALLAKQPDILEKAIYRSCEIKAAVVAADERESGMRAILNFGHTFAHALETGLGYGVMLHGEAVAVGMLMAVDLSHQMGFVSERLVQRLSHMLEVLQLPVQFSADLSVEQVLSLMRRDKKVLDQKMRLIVLEQCGQALITSDFDAAHLDLVIRKRQNEANA